MKLAFEFNGLFWHSEINKNKDYHLNKTELCEDIGITLIHIWEDDWDLKKNIIKSKVLNLISPEINIFDDTKYIIKNLSNKKYHQFIIDFINENSLQEYNSANIKIGLFYNNELVSIITFSKNKNDFNIVNFCSKLNNDYFIKIFDYFINNYDFDKILISIDRNWAKDFIHNSFKLKNKTKPNCSYIIDDVRKKNHINKENIKIFDSGNLKFEFKK